MHNKLHEDLAAMVGGRVVMGKEAAGPVGRVGKVRLKVTFNLLCHFRKFVSGLGTLSFYLPRIPGGNSHNA